MKLQITILLLGLSASVFAQGTQPAGTAGVNSIVSLDVTNINTGLLTGGDFFNNSSTTPHFEVPRGSGKGTIFAGALWLGGKDQQNNLYVSSQTYRQFTPPQVGYWPGPIATNQNQAHSTKYDKIWKVSKAQIQNHIANYHKLFYVTPPEIANWPGNGNTANGEAAQLAPFIDLNNDGIYTPAIGEYPDIKGDQALYVIFNDKGNVKVPASPAMNLEIHAMFYGYNNPIDTAIYNTVFSHYRIINRGQTNFKDFYAGIWTDFDIGYYNDDFVGCDVQRDLYYGFNGDGFDDPPAGYGLNPPAQAVIFLDKKMSNFMAFNNDSNPKNGNPVTASDYYNFMTGKWKDNSSITYGLDGTDSTKPAYRFMYPHLSDLQGYGFSSGNTPPAYPPSMTWDWTEYNRDGNGYQNPAGDRRGLGSIGPFNLNAGQELEFTVAYTSGLGSSAQGSVGHMLYNAQTVRDFFRNSIVSGTKPEIEKQPLLLFPNPATEQLTIQLPDRFENKTATIQITDYTGRKVLEMVSNSTKNLQLNISVLSKGIYQVSVISGNQIISSRLVKI